MKKHLPEISERGNIVFILDDISLVYLQKKGGGYEDA